MVRPGLVTTGMTEGLNQANLTSLPEETSREGLCDLETDHLRETAGSMLHNKHHFAQGYIPEFNLHFLRLSFPKIFDYLEEKTK